MRDGLFIERHKNKEVDALNIPDAVNKVKTLVREYKSDGFYIDNAMLVTPASPDAD
jgi:hypothetical protein